MSLSRRSRRWLILLTVIAAALGALKYFQDELTTRALRIVAAEADKAGHHITFSSARVSIVGGHIRINDLDVVPMADSTMEDSAVRYTVHADVIELSDVDLVALVRHKVLHVGRIELNAPSVAHSFITRVLHPVKETATRDTTQHGSSPLVLLNVDTLRITHATGSSQDRAQTNPALSVADLDLLLMGIRVEQDANGKPMPAVDRIQMDMHMAEAHLKPYYTLALDSMRVRVPEDTALIFGLRFTPDVGPKEYHSHVKTQVELYQATVDTIMLTGFDLSAKLRDGALHAQKLYVAGVSVDIHRDKSIPDIAPYKEKPLMADRVTAWKLPVALDTVTVRRGSVTYHERLKRTDDYGSIAFTDITGRLTGVTNAASEHPADLHLAGTARVGRSHAELDLRMPMQRDHTTVTMHVVLHDFPAKEMNRMTDDLLHVNATAGIIHRVDMHMHGDEDRATGTMEMQYEDLHLEIAPVVKHAGMISTMANAVVRTTNMPGDKNYRVGRFEIERQKDSGVFKYLWISLRTGMMEVVLPPAMLKQMKKQQDKKKAPTEEPKKEKKGLFGKKE